VGVLDVGEQGSVDALFEALKAADELPAILVNNAGITRDNLLMRMAPEEWDQVLNTNLTSLYRVCKAALRSMMRARTGRIINVASVVGLMGNAGQANYSSAKAGVTGLTKTVAKEWGQFNINCNAVAFGFVETRLTQAKEKGESMTAAGDSGEKVELGIPEQMRSMASMMIPLGRPAQPEEAAGPVMFLCSEYANYIHGQVINVTGGQFTGMYS